MTGRLEVVALLGRQAGFLVLRDALLQTESVRVAHVFTHRHRPKAEGGGLRPEYADFDRFCREHRIALTAIEMPQARTLLPFLAAIGTIDLIVSTSWRAHVAADALARARLGGINLHRGDLPRYAGSEPVRRALEAGETRFAITAHRMIEEIDMGAEVAKVWLDDAALRPGESSRARAENIKTRLLPLYAPLARTAITAAAQSDTRLQRD